MKIHPDLKTYAPNQASTLKKHGHEIWDIVCANLTGEEFKTRVAAEIVARYFKWSNKTATCYTLAVLNNVLLDQEHDNPCLLQKRVGLWFLPFVIYN